MSTVGLTSVALQAAAGEDDEEENEMMEFCAGFIAGRRWGQTETSVGTCRLKPASGHAD